MINAGERMLTDIMWALLLNKAEEFELAHKQACEAERIKEEQPLTYRTAWGTFHGS